MRPVYPDTLHIEGMDLAGKSTATKAFLDAHPNARQRCNSLIENNPIYGLADELRRTDQASPLVLGDIYVAALAYELDKTRPAGITVQDSTIILRSLAYNSVIGATHIVERLHPLIRIHPRFALTVVLTANIDVRVQRLRQRQHEAPGEVAPDDLQVITAPERFKAMESALIDHARLYFNAIVVDTSDMTKDEVAATILTRWRQRGG